MSTGGITPQRRTPQSPPRRPFVCVAVVTIAAGFALTAACGGAYSAPATITPAEDAATAAPSATSAPWPGDGMSMLPLFAPPAPTLTATPPMSTATPFPPPAVLAPSPGRPNWSAGLLLQPLRHGDAARHAVYLTFDDGYGYPDQILDVLQQKRARATACLVGVVAVARRGFVQRWVSAGYGLCNHTYSHKRMVARASASDGGFASDVDEITRDQSVLHDVAPSVAVSPFFRPPYGEQNDIVRRAAASLGYRTIIWSLDPRDWRAGVDPSWLRDYVVNNARNGDIILLHFERHSTVEALPAIIDGLRARGFELLGLESLPSDR